MILNKGYSTIYLVYLLVFLGIMSAFGPFVTDMYLPSLPAMTKEFAVSASEVQSGITASLLGFAVGQIFFGPLSDKVGRRPIMFWSLIIFCVSTVCDIYSPTMSVFNIFRFFQGIGGAGGIVLSRSVATDCYSGKELAKTMTIIGAINGIAPIVAPVAGGFVSNIYGWQGVFWVLLAIGLILLGFSVPFVESLSADKRVSGSLAASYKKFIDLMKIRGFMWCILIFALTSGILFSYIPSAPFIVQNIFQYSDTQFSIIFAINAVAIVLGSTISIKFPTLHKSIWCGALLSCLFSILNLVNALTWKMFWLYEISTWFTLVGLGLIFPSVTTMAMERGRMAVGAASAIVGASGFIAGGIISPLSGMFNILLSASILMSVCGTGIIIFQKKLAN